MINKVNLINTINKYHLGGLVESVKWEVKDNKLNVKFTSPTKEMIGEINCNKFDIQDSSVGISNTSQLLKLLSTTTGDLLLSYNKSNKVFTKLIISDNQFTINYALADTLTVPKTGKYTGPNEFNLETELNKEIISALVKAKSALSESETVVFKSFSSMDGDFQLELIFGGDIEYANKISYYISNFKQTDVPSTFELHFNSDLLKEILVTNKDASKANMCINLEGLLKLSFEEENITSEYYIVKKDVHNS